ncbi:MAG: ParB/RepB/Spo0J family partition protein [Dissulfurispiraceae bacterium]
METHATPKTTVLGALDSAKARLLKADEGDARLENVPLELRTPNPYRPGKVLTDIDELTASIKEVEVLELIIVRPVTDDNGETKFELIAGQRRVKVCRQLRLETIQSVINDVWIAYPKTFALIKHIERVDLCLLDIMNGVAGLKEDLVKAASIANSLGKTDCYVRGILKRYDDINSLPDFKKLLEVGKELVLHIYVSKTAKPDESKRSEIRESVEAFLERISAPIAVV